MAVSKPLPGALIDRTAPLAQSVASFWTLNEGAGTAFLDSAGNSPGAASGVVVRSKGGIVLSGSSYVALGKEYAEANKKFSFVTRIKTTTGNQCAIAATWVSGSKAGFYVLLNNVAGKLSVGMASASNAAYIQKDATKSVLDGVEHVIGFDYDASQTLAGLTIYIDGQLAAITNTYIAGTIGAFSHTGFNLGADGAGNLKYVGNIGYAGLFVGGNLGAAGHAAIAQNPWQLWPDEPQLVFAPVTGVTGTSAGTITATGTAAGAVAVAAASTQTLPLTGTSTGAVAVAGASAGTITATGSAVGAATVAGTSSQTVNLTGTATGAAAVAGASSATVDLTGTAAGTIPPLAVSGDSAVTVDLAGTAAGAVAVAGASSGTVNTTGTAAATNPVAGASDATLALTGSAAGAVAVAGASAVTISTTGSATGEVQNFAAVSDGTFTLAGTAAGTVAVAGTSAQQIEVAGAAAFTVRNILGASAGRVQTSASRTEALNSADRQNTYNPARIAAGNGKRGSNVQTGKR